jgi:glycosyltransferase involved in cell wall biosynthesis
MRLFLKRKIKICNVVSTLGLGGTERIIYYVAKYIDYSKYEFHIITLFSKDDENDEPLLSELRKTEAKIFRLQLKSWRDFKTFKKFTSYIHRNKIDIVHAHSGACEFWGTVLGRLANVRNVIFSQHHTVYKNNFSIKIQRYLTYLIFTKKIIAVSESAKHFLINKYSVNNRKIQCIYNPVDLNKFKPIDKDKKLNYRKYFGLSISDFIIGNTSRYQDRKGYIYFFQAAKLIKRYIPNSKFIVIGNKQGITQYQKWIKQYNLGDSVKIFSTTNKIVEILSCIDVYLFTSLWGEGFGIVLIEALAMGIPIVATNVGPTKEIITDRYNGLLSTPNKWVFETDSVDSKELAKSVIYLHNNPDFKEMIKKNAVISVNKFSLERYIKNIEQFYSELLSH